MRNAIVIMSLMLFYGCEINKNDNSIDYSGNNCIDNNENFQPVVISDYHNYQMIFYNDTEIKIYTKDERLNGAQVEPGSNLVFLYGYTYDDDPVIVDDEYAEVILFEIKKGLDDFIISDTDLKECNAMLGVFGNMLECGYHWLTDGCIKGVKISENEWQIDINIITEAEYGDFSKMISERFTIKEYLIDQQHKMFITLGSFQIRRA